MTESIVPTPTPTPTPTPLRVAVLGTGHIGPAIARAARDAGYDVTVSASGSPERISLIAQVVMPGVEPVWAAEGIGRADVVVLAIPLHRFLAIDAEALRGKIVIDAMNYWAPTDGTLAAFTDSALGTSEIVQRHLAGASVVKTLNHTGYHDLEEDRRPAGDPERRAQGVAGDDPQAVALVSRMVDAMGYDPLVIDGLAGGRILQPGGPAFGARLTLAELEDAVEVDVAA
ncbi:NAD(P)-binding domain-containing protein [Herbiconiux sp. CPCC 205763]|uniref:NAD(P)-binding domain-containing protein n=1 Tax=Herbiconiux aconitum TaxID=2970913 RepID=A0ABT2GKD0_9MICO|nr:NAD(P)-binding domain-containing protein [Herbiconiux aconitum]MCS5716675.1 NAD(P)-binding domain-containing protein [Herbiconiux aconitum]